MASQKGTTTIVVADFSHVGYSQVGSTQTHGPQKIETQTKHPKQLPCELHMRPASCDPTVPRQNGPWPSDLSCLGSSYRLLDLKWFESYLGDFRLRTIVFLLLFGACSAQWLYSLIPRRVFHRPKSCTVLPVAASSIRCTSWCG